MTTATIICDASFIPNVNVTGYAGGILLADHNGELSDIYHGVAGDLIDSHSGKMRAITLGALRLNRLAKRVGAPLERVEILTDSASAISNLKRHQAGEPLNPKYATLAPAMVQQLARLGCPVSLRHLSEPLAAAHQAPRQRLQHLVSDSARSIASRVLRHQFHPDTRHSRHYAVVLPAVPRPADAAAMTALGYDLAAQGLLARLRIEGGRARPADHPFVQGIARYAAEQGKPPSGYYRNESWRNDGGMLHGCQGLDQLLLRHHLGQSGIRSLEKWNFDLVPSYNAAIASRLLFGPQFVGAYNTEHLTGRIQPPSAFVINLFDSKATRRPTFANEWINTFEHYVRIPVIQGLDAALARQGLCREAPSVPSVPDPLRERLATVLEDYHGQLSPAQLSQQLAKALGEQAVPVGEPLRQQLAQQCARHPRGGERLLDELLATVASARATDLPATPVHDERPSTVPAISTEPQPGSPLRLRR